MARRHGLRCNPSQLVSMVVKSSSTFVKQTIDTLLNFRKVTKYHVGICIGLRVIKMLCVCVGGGGGGFPSINNYEV